MVHRGLFAYDPENRLITANKTSGGTVAATYAYDPMGRRNHKSGTGVTETYFLDDGHDEIAEYNGNGTGTWRYVPGPAINEPIATIGVSTGAYRFFQTDHHGSVIAVVANNGNEIEGPYTYDYLWQLLHRPRLRVPPAARPTSSSA